MEQLGIVILAAGLGKRMRSTQAKVLHCIAGKPLLSHVVQATQLLHPDRLVVVVGHQAAEVQRVCGGPGIEFALQREQRGTGDAVRAAQAHFRGFRGDVLIVCGDTPLLTTETLAGFVQIHRTRQAIVSVLVVRLDDPAQYGRAIRTNDGQVIKIVEVRDASEQERTVQEVSTGIYCVQADFLFAALARLQPTNAQGEYYLTDIVAQAVSAGLSTQAILAQNPDEVGGINSREELSLMEKTRQDQLRSHWMAAGVTLEDPATVYIDEDVTVGQDTVIGPNTHLKGKTTIGARCRIDGSAYIENCRIGNDVRIRFSVMLEGGSAPDDHIELCDNTEVGPFAHLRKGTILKPHAEIGNFVEVKKSVIGEYTKAKHLSYIGDAEIGRGSNIGAGTITCNYDGFQEEKLRTRIGDNVQIGSGTTLVAPITIPDDVYIATATTLRHDEEKGLKQVPPGAFVFNPRQQEIREGWVTKKRVRQGRKTKGESSMSTVLRRLVSEEKVRSATTSSRAVLEKEFGKDFCARLLSEQWGNHIFASEEHVQALIDRFEHAILSRPSAGEVALSFARTTLAIIGSEQLSLETKKKRIRSLCETINKRPLPTILWADFVKIQLDLDNLSDVGRILACCVNNTASLRERIRETVKKRSAMLNLSGQHSILVFGYSETIVAALEGLLPHLPKLQKIVTPRQSLPGRQYEDGVLLQKRIKEVIPTASIEVVEDKVAQKRLEEKEPALVFMGCKVIGLRKTGELEIVNSRNAHIYAEAAHTAQIPVVVITGAYKLWPTQTYEKYRPAIVQEEDREGPRNSLIESTLVTWIGTEDDLFSQAELKQKYKTYFTVEGVPAASIRECLPEEKKRQDPQVLGPQIEEIAKDFDVKEILLEGSHLPYHFVEAQRFYEEQKKDPTWLQENLGKYVAIIGEKVVDSSKDFAELSYRVREKYGYGSIFMPLVTEGPQVVRIGPRIRKEVEA